MIDRKALIQAMMQNKKEILSGKLTVDIVWHDKEDPLKTGRLNIKIDSPEMFEEIVKSLLADVQEDPDKKNIH